MLLKGNHFCLITNKNIGRLYQLSVFLLESISDIGTCKTTHIGTPLLQSNNNLHNIQYRPHKTKTTCGILCVVPRMARNITMHDW